jgi:hypothetical protein
MIHSTQLLSNNQIGNAFNFNGVKLRAQSSDTENLPLAYYPYGTVRYREQSLKDLAKVLEADEKEKNRKYLASSFHSVRGL